MRTALAVLFLASPLACTQSPAAASRAAVEQQVNERLDRQLHVALKKLISQQVASADAAAPSAGMLSQR